MWNLYYLLVEKSIKQIVDKDTLTIVSFKSMMITENVRNAEFNDVYFNLSYDLFNAIHLLFISFHFLHKIYGMKCLYEVERN